MIIGLYICKKIAPFNVNTSQPFFFVLPDAPGQNKIQFF